MPQPPARRRVRPPRSPVPPAGPAGRASSLLQRAQLRPVPSTLLIPLAARAYGGRYFPWLDCHDAVAQALLTQLGADVNATPDMRAMVAGEAWQIVSIQPDVNTRRFVDVVLQRAV